MASCDDDFSLLGDDPHHSHHNSHHHHHITAAAATHHHPLQQFTPQRYLTQSPQIRASPTQHPVSAIVSGGTSPNKVPGNGENEPVDYTGSSAAFCSNPFSADNDPNPFEDDSDPNRVRVDDSPNDKRKDRDDLSDGGASCNFKKSKAVGGVFGGSGAGPMVAHSSGSGEYRKDREEWCDAAIECLLDAYTDKYTQLNRGNLRGRDWEEVAAIVSDRCENQTKTVEQCKNKVDNLKKRYKLERHRMSSGGISSSHWPWFRRMEAIVGNSLSVKATSEEDKPAIAAGAPGRQQKRYALSSPNVLCQISNIKSKATSSPRWQRVIFKISGAALGGLPPQNIDPKVMTLVAREVATACRLGVQVGVVVGGRNFFCGESWINATGSESSTAYQIGMLATVMNSLLLQSALEKQGVQTRLQTAFVLPEISEPYNKQKAIRHLEKGRVVIFGGVGAGLGNPLFSTDTAAALRATEIHASAMIKGTNINGIYESANDNNTFEHISFRELASRGGTPMDMMSLSLCEENNLSVVVFNLLESGNISRALCGEQVGTLIDQTGTIS